MSVHLFPNISCLLYGNVEAFKESCRSRSSNLTCFLLLHQQFEFRSGHQETDALATQAVSVKYLHW